MILTRLHRPMLKRRHERDTAKRHEKQLADSAEAAGLRSERARLTQVTIIEPRQRRAYIENAGPPTQPLWRVVLPLPLAPFLGPRNPPPFSESFVDIVDFESVMMAMNVPNQSVFPGEETQIVWWEWRPRGHTVFPVKSATRGGA